MEITKIQSENTLQLKIRGRVDAYWSDHLTKEIEDLIQAGTHHFVLDMADVDYISSAGIRVLIHFYKQLKTIKGSFSVQTVSEEVHKVLTLVGLQELLIPGKKDEKEKPKQKEAAEFDHPKADIEIFSENPQAVLKDSLIGRPDLLSGNTLSEKDSKIVSLPKSVFGIGIGAFGHNYQDCQNRFGEFLSVSGAASYLPTDGTKTPDFMMAKGDFVPEMHILSGIVLKGKFSSLVRFEKKHNADAISLEDLIDVLLNIAKADKMGFVLLAETDGLVGASLRRSPAIRNTDENPYQLPMAREWFTFTSERSYAKNLVLVAGIAAKGQHDDLDPYIRSISSESSLKGHFHALVFPYRPIQKGKIVLQIIIDTLFDTENLLDLLHLIHDDRGIEGVGQSEFIRGACWIAPIGES